MAEVSNQLHPFKESLDRLSNRVGQGESWRLKLWSNGSGGPPGYLENARDEDKKWKKELFDVLNPIVEWVSSKKAVEIHSLNKRNAHLAVLSVLIAFLAMMVGFFAWLESRKIKTGELENPIHIIFPEKRSLTETPVVYAKEEIYMQQTEMR